MHIIAIHDKHENNKSMFKTITLLTTSLRTLMYENKRLKSKYYSNLLARSGKSINVNSFDNTFQQLLLLPLSLSLLNRRIVEEEKKEKSDLIEFTFLESEEKEEEIVHFPGL